MKRQPNEKGQILVESVLLMALLAGITVLVQSQIQRRGFLNNLIAKPWESVSGMAECGVWGPCAAGKHPLTRNRTLSLDPKDK